MKSFPILAIGLACALAACGGEDEADRIADVIDRAATTDDPAICTELMTPAFLAQTEAGDDPLQECEEDQLEGDDSADSTEISAVEIDGERASAEVAFSGGPTDGQTVAVELVKEGDNWKLDRVDSFVEFNRDAFFAATEKDFSDDPALGAEFARCAIPALEELTDQEIQEIFISGEDARVVRLVAEDCPDEYREALIRSALENAEIPPEVRRCIARAMERLPEDQLTKLTLPANRDLLQRYVEAACSDVANEGETTPRA
jgi:hypothetical protein